MIALTRLSGPRARVCISHSKVVHGSRHKILLEHSLSRHQYRRGDPDVVLQPTARRRRLAAPAQFHVHAGSGGGSGARGGQGGRGGSPLQLRGGGVHRNGTKAAGAGHDLGVDWHASASAGAVD